MIIYTKHNAKYHSTIGTYAGPEPRKVGGIHIYI